MTNCTDTTKDSGVQWIGEIPSDWEVEKLKNLYSFGKGLTITKEDLTENGIPVISYGQIHSKTNKGTHISDDLIRFVPDYYLNDSPQSLVNKGDFIFADTSEDIEGAGNCVFVDREMTLFAGYHSIILKNKFLNYTLGKYLSYLFQTTPWRTQVRSKVNGIKVYSISQRILKDITVILPNQNEQQQIADYLDNKCGEIDKVIETEKSVIEKLKEYKQSIITEAVTKGLDKSTPLKDSGIEWIGKIPQHWETCKLLKLYKERKCKNKGNIETNVLSLSYGNIKKRNIENNMGLLPESFETYNIIVPDNIVLRLTDLQNDHRSLRCGLVKEQGIITSAYVTLEKKLDNISSNYYYRLLHTFDIMKGFYGMGDGVRQNLKYDGELCNLLVVRPPYTEQQQIAEYLDNKCSEIDKAIADKEQVIERFTEYKKSLIYECVTGKKRVIA